MPPMPWTKGDGVVVVTDMYGGSPSNLSLRPAARRTGAS
jgi:mannose/fructose-specific phosphotransferase system component IIA